MVKPAKKARKIASKAYKGVPAAEKTPPRKDGRKAFFTYMKPEVAEAVKAAAADEGLKAWQFIEQAVKKALRSRRQS